MVSLAEALKYVGGFVVLKGLYKLVSFFWLYLRPSSYHQYLYGAAPYALVTGATDGIGKATAKELYAKGFSLILHGRNEEKLRQVQKEIQAGGSRDVRIWVLDASAPNPDFEKAVEQWKDIEITLVIHNVGGAPFRADNIDKIPQSELEGDLRRNATFPFFLTRALLPKLRRAAGPVELVFIGSMSNNIPMPCLIPYAATKAFIKQLSATIGAQERFRTITNIRTLHLTVSSVVTHGHPVDRSVFSPPAETYGKNIVAHIGCGRRDVIPHIIHAIQVQIVSLMSSSDSILEKAMNQGMEDEMAAVARNS